MRRSESGFILATVLVFLVVLSLTAFLGARLTRSDIQVVNNLQNEKEALAIADAGIQEALYRLSLATNDKATITGVNGGTAFDASITPQSASAWNAEIVFTTAGPSTSGNTLTTPSLQPISTARLPYTVASGSGALSVAWDLCNVSTDIGCGGYPTEPRRQLPLSSPRPVVKITSTGQSGTARRTVVAKAVDCVDSGTGGPGSITSLGTDCSNSVSLNGGSSISAAGAVTINAGATGSQLGQNCTSASTGGSTSIVSAESINTVGVTSGNFNPAATTGTRAVLDPYADPLMQPPCFPSGPTPCQGTSPPIRHGTADAPSRLTVTTNDTTLDAGIYYGGLTISASNVHLNPGVYIMAGGGFKSSTGTTSVFSNSTGGDGSGGVMIFNTQDPVVTTGAGAIDNIDLSQGNCTANIVAPTSGAWTGVVVYQDRRSSISQPTIFISGGNSTRVLDGLIYAPLAGFAVKGGSPSGTLIGGSMVVNSVSMIGNSSLIVQEGSTTPPTPNCSGIAYVPIGWQDF